MGDLRNKIHNTIINTGSVVDKAVIIRAKGISASHRIRRYNNLYLKSVNQNDHLVYYLFSARKAKVKFRAEVKILT